MEYLELQGQQDRTEYQGHKDNQSHQGYQGYLGHYRPTSPIYKDTWATRTIRAIRATANQGYQDTWA